MTQRNATVNLRGDASHYIRSVAQARTATAAFIRSLDSSNDRMSMLVQTGLALGPALAPIGAAAVPALAGLTNQLAFASIGAGTAVLAFAGVGDALKDLNEFALDPTEANFEKMQESMAKLGPAGQGFVAYLQQLRPEMQRLQDIAQEGLFPGLMVGMDELMELMPRVEGIISEVSSATGQLMAEAGDNLNDPRWREFFGFLEAEARPTLIDLGRTIGNFGEGFAQLWMAFDPVSDRFSRSFLNLSRDFREWASALDETQGFQDFVDYLARITPKVWDTLGSLAEALLAVATAAAPVGEAALPVIELLAETLTAVAESPAGPALIAAAAGISAISRAVALYHVANGSALLSFLRGAGGQGTAAGISGTADAARRGVPSIGEFGTVLYRAGQRAQFASEKTLAARQSVGQFARSAAPAAAAIGTLGLALTDLDESIGLSNTATYAMMGMMAGPWGAAIGASVGAVQDLRAANDDLASAIKAADAAIESADYQQITDAIANLQEKIDGSGGLSQTIANFAEGKDWLSGGMMLIDSLDVLGASSDEANDAMRRLQDAKRQAAVAAQEQKFAEAGLAEEMAGASSAARDQVEALLDSAAAKNANRDAALEGRAAERELEEAIDAATEAVTRNGATLDITTEAGRANEEALDGIAAAWNNMSAEAQRVPGRYEEVRAAFIQTAINMGHTSAQAENLAAQLLDVPTAVSTEISTPGGRQAVQTAIDVATRIGMIPPGVSTFLRAVDQASGVISNVATALYRLSSGVTIPVRVSMPGALPTLNDIYARAQANGGVLSPRARAFADGGFDEYGRPVQRVPQIRGGHEGVVMWGEPETHWEAYVSGKPSMRERNKSVLAEAAARLGGEVTWFANGGYVGGVEAVSPAELTRIRLRIRDLERKAREGETHLERVLAIQELAEARVELGVAERASRDAARRGWSAERWNAVQQGGQDFRRDAFQLEFTSAAGVERQLQQMLAASAQFTLALADLKRKGASPLLLEQLMRVGPSRSSVRVARQLAADTARLRRLNALAGQVDQVSAQYATITTDPRFLSYGAAQIPTGAMTRQLEQIVKTAVAAAVKAAPPIHVHPQPGMSEEQVAQMTAAKVQGSWR